MRSAFSRGAGSFTSASLGTSVLAIQGEPTSGGIAVLGQFSTTNHASNPSSFSGVGDEIELNNGVQSNPAAPIAGTYTISANGVGTMGVTTANLGSFGNLKFYMTDPLLNLNDPNNPNGGGGALALETDALLAGATGVIVPQTDTAPASVTGHYVVGAQSTSNDQRGFCEFAMASQGTIQGGVLTVTGDISDPLETFLERTLFIPDLPPPELCPRIPPTLGDMRHSIWQ